MKCFSFLSVCLFTYNCLGRHATGTELWGVYVGRHKFWYEEAVLMLLCLQTLFIITVVFHISHGIVNCCSVIDGQLMSGKLNCFIFACLGMLDI